MENERQSTDDSLPEVSDIVETHNMVDQMTSQVDDSSGSGQTLATQVLLGNMPNDVFVYRQDVVSCKKYEGLLGVVMEVAGDSDSDESITDDSDSEDDVDVTNGGDASKGGDNNNTDGDDDNDSLPDGQVRVVWTDGSETTGNITDITVVDRGFLHGDIVSSAAHPSGQLGLVVDVGITVDLLSANGEVIKNVNSKDLKRIREFTVGDYVVKGPWLGRVDDVLDNVTVLFDDGSICKVVKADPLRLQPVSKPVIDDSGCPYYPGQRIRAVSSSVFKSSRWLSGLWKANRLEGTVINVQTASVVVYWIASAYVSVDTNSSTVPSEEQNPKDLTLLDCFSYSNWQLGDWCLLPSSNADGTLKGSKHKEPVNGIGEHTDTNMNSCSESSVQCFHGTDLVNTGTQISEELNTLANVMDIEGVEYDSHEQQLASCANIDDCSGDWDSTPRESNSTDPMELDEGNVAVPNLILLKDASSSIPSSVSKEAAANEYWPSYRRKLRKVLFKRDKKGRRRDETFERALFIINTVTKVDVAWQNGTKEYALDSTSLIPVQTPNDHDFFPEQYVVEKSADEGEDTSETKHTGIVRTLNAKDKTVCVRWFKPVARPEDAWEFDYDEVVSAYQLDGHPDYDYCYGDVVVRLSPVLYTGNTSDLEGATGHKEGNLSDMQSNDDRGQQLPSDEACEDFTSLSWVGNITGLRDGDIEVTWADGMVSKVGPQAIYVVGRDDDGDSFGGGSEASNDGASWETVDENDMNTLKTVENVDSLNEDAELSSSTDVHPGSPPQNSNLGRNGPLSMPLAALGYVTRLASGFFSRGKKESDSECSSEIGNALRENHVASELNHVTSDALDGQNHTKKVPETAETDDTETTEDINMSTPVGRIGDSIVEESLDGFKHFDITENPLDHYFLGSSGGQGLGGRKWVKKVQQEWSILEKNLPDAIFVRVFEDRMDLLRAVIIGAPGTPYQDGLFFFDFHLLPEYPVVPPSVYYHSGGLRVNPNLYVDGKVCLSLLNTWTGKGNEVWDPSSSSILQVLVSLQGLVLNSKPYFNEAGYDKQVGTIEGEKNSLPYNENTYLLNLKSMMYLLRRPPMFFEGFIRDHFRQRGHYILKACAAYMGGCTIGSLTKDACLTEKSNEYPCSVGFKLMLAKILPRLITALTEVGVDCHQFEHSQASNNLPTA